MFTSPPGLAKGSKTSSSSLPVFLRHLSRFDAFPKARDEAAEFFQRTAAGGIISIVAAVLMGVLFLSELGKPSFAILLLSQFV